MLRMIQVTLPLGLARVLAIAREQAFGPAGRNFTGTMAVAVKGSTCA